MELDIDSINEIYNYGGEKGKRNDEQTELEDAFYQEIAELAKNCVKYMSKLFLF